jgi:hypothetical protein
MIVQRNVITNYKANTSDHERGIGRIGDKWRSVANEEAKAAKAREKNGKDWLGQLSKVGLSMETLKKGVELGKKSLEQYGKTSADAMAKVKSITDASERAFNTVLASIGKTVAGLEPLITGVATLVGKLSEVGVAGPAAIGALALAVTGNPVIAGIIGGTAWAASGEYGVSTLRNANGDYDFALGAARVEANEQRKRDLEATKGRFNVGDFNASLARLPGLIGTGLVVGLQRVGVDQWAPFQARSRGTLTREQQLRRQLGARTTDFDFGDGGSYAVGSAASTSSLLDIDMNAANRVALTNRWQGELAANAANSNRSQTRLEQMFGPLEQFNAYATAFDTLSGAASSALGAWIDGSMSAGKAFKLFIGDALKALSQQMLVEGLKHGAYALGSLAFGDIGGAGRHAAAAAAFGAGAGLAAVAAKSMGTSASASAASSAPATAPRTSAPSNDNSRGGSERVVVYEDSFVEANAYERARRARRVLNRTGGARRATRAA